MKTTQTDWRTTLADVEREFVELWGSMSSLGGVSPAIARIHGALFITGQAMTAEELMDRLGISRGNVSMNLAKLVEWGLVRRVHRPGDRREYYESLKDVWEMFATVAVQRGPALEYAATLRGKPVCRVARFACQRRHGAGPLAANPGLAQVSHLDGWIEPALFRKPSQPATSDRIAVRRRCGSNFARVIASRTHEEAFYCGHAGQSPIFV